MINKGMERIVILEKIKEIKSKPKVSQKDRILYYLYNASYLKTNDFFKMGIARYSSRINELKHNDGISINCDMYRDSKVNEYGSHAIHSVYWLPCFHEKPVIEKRYKLIKENK